MKQELLYTPYGDTFVDLGSADIERYFTGQIKDKESGLMYYNNRYYDSELGTFTRPDPAMDGVNHYGYVNGNPVRYSDPTGLWGIEDTLTRKYKKWEDDRGKQNNTPAGNAKAPGEDDREPRDHDDDDEWDEEASIYQPEAVYVSDESVDWTPLSDAVIDLADNNVDSFNNFTKDIKNGDIEAIYSGIMEELFGTDDLIEAAEITAISLGGAGLFSYFSPAFQMAGEYATGAYWAVNNFTLSVYVKLTNLFALGTAGSAAYAYGIKNLFGSTKKWINIFKWIANRGAKNGRLYSPFSGQYISKANLLVEFRAFMGASQGGRFMVGFVQGYMKGYSSGDVALPIPIDGVHASGQQLGEFFATLLGSL